MILTLPVIIKCDRSSVKVKINEVDRSETNVMMS